MRIQRLHELKRKLRKEKDLSKIWLFYMDNFADHKAFTDLGAPAKNDYLNAVLQATCGQMVTKVTKITNFCLIHIPEYQFFHGPFLISGQSGGVIFFEDIKMGLLAISADYPASNLMKYSRFSEPIRLSPPTGHELN